MIPERGRSARAEGFRRTARVMAALGEEELSEFRVEVISLTFVGLCGWKRCLPAHCNVRVTGGCGRPAAIQTRGTIVKPWSRRSGISFL